MYVQQQTLPLCVQLLLLWSRSTHFSSRRHAHTIWTGRILAPDPMARWQRIEWPGLLSKGFGSALRSRHAPDIDGSSLPYSSPCFRVQARWIPTSECRRCRGAAWGGTAARTARSSREWPARADPARAGWWPLAGRTPCPQPSCALDLNRQHNDRLVGRLNASD